MLNWHKISETTNILLSAWHQVIKSSLAHWRLLSSILVGVLLSSTILASTVIYFDTLKQMSLSQAISQKLPTELDISIRTQRGPTTREEYTKILGAMTSAINTSVDWFITDIANGGRTPTFFLSERGEESQAGHLPIP